MLTSNPEITRAKIGYRDSPVPSLLIPVFQGEDTYTVIMQAPQIQCGVNFLGRGDSEKMFPSGILEGAKDFSLLIQLGNGQIIKL
jgi:hypothetical protein